MLIDVKSGGKIRFLLLKKEIFIRIGGEIITQWAFSGLSAGESNVTLNIVSLDV